MGVAMKYYAVDIPSETRPGEWWEWGTFDTTEEAVKELRDAGIPVTDEGYLLLLTELEGEIWCEACEWDTQEGLFGCSRCGATLDYEG
jgi:hypothetical protein